MNHPPFFSRLRQLAKFVLICALGNSCIGPVCAEDQRASPVADGSGQLAALRDQLKIASPLDDPGNGQGSSGDEFGRAIAISGNTAVVGAPEKGTLRGYQGAVLVFVRAGNEWTLQAKLTSTSGQYFEKFGRSVAIHGDTVVVGAPHDLSATPRNPGGAFVFVRENGTWSQQAALLPADGIEQDQFGWSVAVDGNLAIVGAPTADSPTRTDSGAAYIFERSGSQWQPASKLMASDHGSGDEFGASVSISGDIAAVGAPYDSNAVGTNAGSLYVYARLVGSWSQSAKLSNALSGAGGQLGFSIDVDANTLVGGARYDSTMSGTAAGSALVYERQGDSWIFEQRISRPGAVAADQFGYAVSVSAEKIVVGSPFSDIDNKANAGSAHLFERSEGVWTHRAEVSPSALTTSDFFGAAVSIDSGTLVGGAWAADTLNGSLSGLAFAVDAAGPVVGDPMPLWPGTGADFDNFGTAIATVDDLALIGAPDEAPAGAAYLFRRDGNAWQLVQRFAPGSSEPGAGFGMAVALLPDTVFVSALRDTLLPGASYRSGAVYVYSLVAEDWTETAKFTAQPRSNDDQFGVSIAAFGNGLLVGAPSHDPNGGAYYFERIAQTWSPAQVLTVPMAQYAGTAVALNSTTAVIGDTFANEGTGAVHVFSRNGPGWQPAGSLVPVSGALYGRFGAALALSANTVAIGAPEGGATGEVHVFANDTGAWLPQGVLAPDPALDLDFLGTSVAIDGDTILAGAPDWEVSFQASVARFDRSFGVWQPTGIISPAQPKRGTAFGSSIAIGNGFVLIGAPEEHSDRSGNRQVGYMYVLQPGVFADGFE